MGKSSSPSSEYRSSSKIVDSPIQRPSEKVRGDDAESGRNPSSSRLEPNTWKRGKK
jgi:hypothetical protein